MVLQALRIALRSLKVNKLRTALTMLGISDGSATEIVRGDLKEGQDVVVGLAGGAQNRPATGGAPRLRL